MEAEQPRDNALLSKCTKVNILGPFNAPPLTNLRCSSLDIVPKYNGDYQAIYHLSAPLGSSIYDFIDSTHTHLNTASLMMHIPQARTHYFT